MGRGGFEPPKPKQQIYSLPVLTTYLPSHNGSGTRARTWDNLINSQVLYLLSYSGIVAAVSFRSQVIAKPWVSGLSRLGLQEPVSPE